MKTLKHMLHGLNIYMIEGDFDCGRIGLESLEGAPKIVDGGFNASNNELTNLKYLPTVHGSLKIGFNKLTSLKGCQEKYEGNFIVVGNKLTSLEGAPRIVHGSVDISSNPLESLKGCPYAVGRDFTYYRSEASGLAAAGQRIYNYKLKTLDDFPKSVGGAFRITGSILETIKKDLNMSWDELEEHIRKTCGVKGEVFIAGIGWGGFSAKAMAEINGN
jgi:hypothetical protein